MAGNKYLALRSNERMAGNQLKNMSMDCNVRPGTRHLPPATQQITMSSAVAKRPGDKVIRNNTLESGVST